MVILFRQYVFRRNFAEISIARGFEWLNVIRQRVVCLVDVRPMITSKSVRIRRGKIILFLRRGHNKVFGHFIVCSSSTNRDLSWRDTPFVFNAHDLCCQSMGLILTL